MKETIIERLQCFMESLGINNNQMTVNAGLSVGLIGKSIKTNKGIHSDSIEKILHSYPILNPLWLLTGDGDMLRHTSPRNDVPNTLNEEKNSLENSHTNGHLLDKIEEKTESHDKTINQPLVLRKELCQDEQNKELLALQAERGIPLIPDYAFAGFAPGNDIQILELNCEKYVIPHFKGADGLIHVKGSSMYPKYNSGDIVAFKKLSMGTFFQWNKVYIIDTEQGLLIKRVQQADDGEHIILVSDNPNYKPFPLPLTDIYSLAIVVGVIRLE